MFVNNADFLYLKKKYKELFKFKNGSFGQTFCPNHSLDKNKKRKKIRETFQIQNFTKNGNFGQTFYPHQYSLDTVAALEP